MLSSFRKRRTTRIVTPEEPPSKSTTINATLPHRLATLCAVFFLGKLKHRFGDVLFLTDAVCVKYGKWVDLSEAASMEFIRKNTSVPVPKVDCAFTHKGKTFLPQLERAAAWWPSENFYCLRKSKRSGRCLQEWYFSHGYGGHEKTYSRPSVRQEEPNGTFQVCQ